MDSKLDSIKDNDDIINAADEGVDDGGIEKRDPEKLDDSPLEKPAKAVMLEELQEESKFFDLVQGDIKVEEKSFTEGEPENNSTTPVKIGPPLEELTPVSKVQDWVNEDWSGYTNPDDDEEEDNSESECYSEEMGEDGDPHALPLQLQESSSPSSSSTSTSSSSSSEDKEEEEEKEKEGISGEKDGDDVGKPNLEEDRFGLAKKRYEECDAWVDDTVPPKVRKIRWTETGVEQMLRDHELDYLANVVNGVRIQMEAVSSMVSLCLCLHKLEEVLEHFEEGEVQKMSHRRFENSYPDFADIYDFIGIGNYERTKHKKFRKAMDGLHTEFFGFVKDFTLKINVDDAYKSKDPVIKCGLFVVLAKRRIAYSIPLRHALDSSNAICFQRMATLQPILEWFARNVTPSLRYYVMEQTIKQRYLDQVEASRKKQQQQRDLKKQEKQTQEESRVEGDEETTEIPPPEVNVPKKKFFHSSLSYSLTEKTNGENKRHALKSCFGENEIIIFNKDDF